MIGAGLEQLLRGTDYEIVGRARCGPDALSEVERLNPDLLLLDVNMPDQSGIEVLRRMRRNGDRRAVILITAGMDDSQLIAADELQPAGIVLKTSDPGLLMECMDRVCLGGRWVDPEIAARTVTVKARAAEGPLVTPRERQIVDLVRQGLRNREIADKLGVTEGTVKVYLHAIFDKIGVENRTELAMRAADLLGTTAASAR
jgi:two-component system nitrate/nitrite response regulator NarP